MEDLILTKVLFNPSKNKKLGIRFKDGSWFQLECVTVPMQLLYSAVALLDLASGEVLKQCPGILNQEIDYVKEQHSSGRQKLPILELLHSRASEERQCVVLASYENLIVLFCYGCSTADINKARSAYYGGIISGIDLDERIEELIHIQHECEIEKTALVNQRRKALRTSRFVVTDTLRAGLLPWDVLRRDFGYVGDLLHTCAACGSYVDKFIVTESLLPYLGGCVDDTYVRCLNLECSNSCGQVFAGEHEKPEWLQATFE